MIPQSAADATAGIVIVGFMGGVRSPLTLTIDDRMKIDGACRMISRQKGTDGQTNSNRVF
jgi:hypothetical protein